MKIIYTGGEGEIVEKKSRFIATLRPVQTEAEAIAFIGEMKKKYWDARHNCSAFVIGKNQEISRCSDDGEPSQTAGRPMLDVLLKEEIHNAAVVVTRYFGGILLGAGGLTRAYSRSAKDALDASGISVVRPWIQVETDCPYALFERLKLELIPFQGVEGEHGFGTSITFRAFLPEGAEEAFDLRLRELSAGELKLRVVGMVWKAVSCG